jgi:hypothetical protein
MNKFIKFSLAACLTLIGTFAFAQGIPLINGSATTKINGVNGYTAVFTVSGCTSGYDWSFSDNQGRTSNLSDTWDVVFGSASTSTIETVPLGADPNGVWLPDPKSPYRYEVACVGQASPKAVVEIHMISVASTFKPTVTIAERTCSNAEDENSGALVLKASGCFDAVTWTYPDGAQLTRPADQDGILYLNGNYQEGTYSAQCTFNSLGRYMSDSPLNSNEFPTSGIAISRQQKEYFPPSVVKLTSPDGKGAGDWTEICAGQNVSIGTNLPAVYNGKMGFQWFREGQLLTTTNASITTGSPGSYVVRVHSRGGVNVCDFKTAQFSVSIVPLKKPVILGNNKYCLDGTTELKVDSASYVIAEGYKKPQVPYTVPVSYKWYLNGVETSSLGNKPSIKVGQNTLVQVSYVTNYECTSGLSDTLTVSNYPRPETPSITAKTKLGWCFGTPIQAILESSALPNGEVTKYEWSNKLTEKVVNIDKEGSYTVRTINTDGCFSLPSTPTVITVLPLPAAPTIATVNNAPSVFCAKSESGTINSVSLVATTTNDVIWSTKFEGKILADVRTSGLYTATARDINGCISLSSNSIKVVAQANPALASDTRILKEGVYTLKATNFPSAATVNATGAGEYVWKFGSALLTPKTFVTKVKTAGEYTVARKYLYTIDGTPLTCITDAVKYTYTVDPDFSGVAVYPNPITAASSADLTAKIQIQILEDWTNGDVTLFDMVGRPVYAGKIANTDGTSIIEVSGLANGIYILQIKADGGKSFVGKVIVNK